MQDIEQNFLSLYYEQNLSTTEICECLNIKRDKGYKILKKYGLNSHIKPRTISDDIIENFCKQYKSGKTIKELSNIFGLKEGTINYWLKKYNITRPRGTQPNFNEKYFETIDSPSKAYFLGLLYADGSIIKSRSSWTISLELQVQDKYLIEEFAKELGCDVTKVKEYKTHNSFNGYNKLKHNAYIHLGSKTMAQDLSRLGCVRNKTFELESIPKISEEYIVNFIMGFFDGDGIASLGDKSHYIGFCGTKDMMDSISNAIHYFNNDITIKKSNYNKNNHIYYLTYGRKDAIILYEWLYSNNKIFLKRKKEKFEKIKL